MLVHNTLLYSDSCSVQCCSTFVSCLLYPNEADKLDHKSVYSFAGVVLLKQLDDLQP